MLQPSHMNNIYCTYVWQNNPLSFLSLLFSLSFFMHSKAFIHCTKGKTSFPILIPFPPLHYDYIQPPSPMSDFFHFLWLMCNNTSQFHSKTLPLWCTPFFTFWLPEENSSIWCVVVSGSMVAREKRIISIPSPSFRIHNAQILVLPTTHFRHDYKINQDFSCAVSTGYYILYFCIRKIDDSCPK